MSLLEPLKLSDITLKKLRIPLLIFFACPIVLLFLFLGYAPWVTALGCAEVCGFSCLFFFKFDLHKVIASNSLLGYIMSVAVSMVFFISSYYGGQSVPIMVFGTLTAFHVANLPISLLFRYGCDGKLHPKNLLPTSFGAVTLAFTLFIYLPSDSFINNLKDFDFTYQDFIFFMLIPFILTVAVIEGLGLLLNKKFLNIFLSLLAGINLCIFAQCMFFNSKLGLLDGVEMNWNDYTGYSILTSIALLIILALPFLGQFLLNKVWKMVVKKIPLFIGIIEGISLIILGIATEGEMFEPDSFSLSGKEQYVVSPGKNIITIVLDAAENQYVTAALEEKPEIFEGYEDFTVYTNTCSVFDSTFQSFTQIFSGFEELPIYEVDKWNHDAWSCEKGIEFFDRFHEAGYKMNFFVDASWDLSLLEGRLDNIEASSVKSSFSTAMGVIGDFNRLTAYRAMPFALKRFFMVDDLDVNRNFGFGVGFNYYNDSFEEDIDTMKLADSDQNYFVVEHIWGAHTPFTKDNFMDTMEDLMDIVRQYLDNLKKLGVYDDSTIIIMADHGSHDLHKYPNSTPMFMIKEAGKRSEELTLNSAPIYYTDLMSTYLVNAGLFDKEKDTELFGKSIYDFEEGEKRERVAHYRYNDKNYPPSNKSPLVPSFGYNVIYSFKYTGDSKNLLTSVRVGPTQIDHMEEDAS